MTYTRSHFLYILLINAIIITILVIRPPNIFSHPIDYGSSVHTRDLDYNQRISHFRKQCSKLTFLIADHALPIVFMPSRNLSYCMLSKTGTTTWARQLLNMSGTPHDQAANVHLEIRDAFPLPEKEFSQLEDVFSMIFVRHPFVKLVSAFRMLNKKGGLRLAEIMNVPEPFRGLRPKLSELSRLLCKTAESYDYLNVHFKPFWFRCQPCNLHLDFIGKVETYARDHDYVSELLHLNISSELKSLKLNGNNQMHSSEVFAKKMFTKLTKEQVRQLYKVYELDFLLFDYDIEPYLSLAK